MPNTTTSIAPGSRGRPSRGTRVRRSAGAVVLAIAIAIVTVPTSAMAAAWGPRSSYYQGIKRVSASGSMSRLANASRADVAVCDTHNEGWSVYGYVNWKVLTTADQVGGVAFRGDTGRTGACKSAGWTRGWTNIFGYWVESAGCAQVGWPVPDNCTAVAVEVHRP